MKPIIEKIILDSGADLFGVASVERFADAPPGNHPKDIYQKTESVIVFAIAIPSEPLFAENPIPYTMGNHIGIQKTDLLAFDIARNLEKKGILTVPLPSDDPVGKYDAATQHAQGALSMRHAGMLAGLGKLGRNSLLINDRFGSMIQIGALLTSTRIEPTPLATYDVCPPKCSRCIAACPEQALQNGSVVQRLCRHSSTVENEYGITVKNCYECRKRCPHVRGIRKENK